MIKYCPCGTEKRYLDCCGAYLQKKMIPETPEALMRSRYSAFVEKNVLYIRKTMRPPALQHFNKKRILDGKEQWLGLNVIQSESDPHNPDIGYVEFIAHFQLNGKHHQIQEKSEFHRIDGKWYYVDGK